MVSGLLSVSLACAQVENDSLQSGVPIAAQCPAEGAGDSFFHPAAARGDNSYLERYAAVYARQADMQRLWCGTDRPETYRLVYLPASRPVLVISLEHAGGDILGRTRWAAKTIRFEDPRQAARQSRDRVQVVDRSEAMLSANEVNSLLLDLGAAFSNAPAWRSAPEVEDGSGIVIEARRNNSYQVVARLNADVRLFELASAFARVVKVSAPELEDDIHGLRKREDAERKP
jgi:hypothetical protein